MESEQERLKDEAPGGVGARWGKKAAEEPLHGCGLYLKPALVMKRALLVYPESRREARIILVRAGHLR